MSIKNTLFWRSQFNQIIQYLFVDFDLCGIDKLEFIGEFEINSVVGATIGRPPKNGVKSMSAGRRGRRSLQFVEREIPYRETIFNRFICRGRRPRRSAKEEFKSMKRAADDRPYKLFVIAKLPYKSKFESHHREINFKLNFTTHDI